MCWLARGLYREFSWALYQHVSPDRKIQTKYMIYQDEMVFYSCVALGFSALALVVGTVCLFNFKKGLRPILLGQVQRKPRAHELEDDYYVQRLNYNVVPLADRDSQRWALD
ncbi:unnamed protein product [Alternaria alternata]